MYENSSLISDWDTLRLVLSIDRHGGVAGAARALGTTHATVSRRLSRAEERAGTLFFERLPAGLRITAAGQGLLKSATAIEQEINAIERNLMRAGSGEHGTLRVTVPPLMMTDALSNDIAEFVKNHPGVELEFVGDNNLLNLHQREADIAIRVTRKPPETLWGRKVTDQHAGFYAQNDWLKSSPLSKGNLTTQIPLISFSSWKTDIPKQLKQLCPNVKIVSRCDEMTTAMQMVKAGIGITRMPRILGERLENVSRITCLPWEGYFPIWLLTHPELRKVQRVELFMQHIAAKIAGRKQDYQAPVMEIR